MSFFIRTRIHLIPSNNSDFLLIEILCDSRENLEALKDTISCIEFDRIDLAYQKQFDLESGKLTGMEALLRLRDEKGKIFDAVMILQPTSPFRTPDHIKGAIRLLKKNKMCTCVASIKRLADHHPKRIKKLNEKGQLLDYCYHAKEPEPSRRQDFLPHAYIRNGAIYLTRTNILIKDKLIRGDYVIGMEMPESNSINIDEHFDFISASAALQYEEFNKDLEFFVNFINSKQKNAQK